MYAPQIESTGRWRRRAYVGLADLVRMQELQREGWRRLGPAGDSLPGDLEWWMNGNADPDVDWSTRIALWETPSGELRGWSWLYGTELEWYVHPQESDGLLRQAQLDWYRERMAPEPAAIDEPPVLTTWSTTRQPDLDRILARAGYEQSDKQLIHSIIDLPRSAAANARTHEGYTIRGVQGAAEIPRRVAVHRSAFEPSRMTAERYAQVMRAPSYRPELDVVAVAADGTFAAFCLAWYDADMRVGLLEPVGTEQAHRRRALAAAVCAEALRRLEELGAERASVLSIGGTEGPNHLYRSLGFREVMRSMQWRRTLDAADDAPADGAVA